MTFWTNEDLQNALERCHNDKGFIEYVDKEVTYFRDNRAIHYCLNENYYEAFDRFDSDVCEKFIRLYKEYYKKEGE